MGRLYSLIAITALVTMLFSGLLTGCGTVNLMSHNEEAVDATAVAKYWDGPKIGAGMTLIIQIGSAATKPVDMHVLVDQNGEVTIPYLLQNPIKCDGMSLDDMKQRLVKEYSVYIRQPQVTVTFGSYDGSHGVSPWGTVRVMGEVGSPGPVNMPPTMDLTVTKVLQLSGGVKPFADRENIVVTRCDKDGKQTRTIVNLKEIGEDGRFDKDIILKAGDVVYVPETWY